MTEGINTTATAPRLAGRDRTRRATRELLAAGAVAGPLWVALAAVQIVARPGFDLSRHAISALTLGDAGWVQVASFIASGLLVLAFAIGVRASLRGGRGGTLGPRFLAIYGAGLVLAGVFVPDPALGFPPGAPDGMPSTYSTSAMLHGVGFMTAFSALVAATLVIARRFALDGARGWALYSLASGLGALVLSAWPGTDGAGIRYAIAAVIAWTWVAAIALRLRRDQPI